MSTIVCDCLESFRATCAQESTDETICVICQETLPDDCPATVKLGCGHTFHGQCAVNHLLNDGSPTNAGLLASETDEGARRATLARATAESERAALCTLLDLLEGRA